MPNTNGLHTAQILKGNHKSNPITLKKKNKKKKERSQTQKFLAMTLKMGWRGERFVLCHLPNPHSHLPAYGFALQCA